MFEESSEKEKKLRKREKSQKRKITGKKRKERKRETPKLETRNSKPDIKRGIMCICIYPLPIPSRENPDKQTTGGTRDGEGK